MKKPAIRVPEKIEQAHGVQLLRSIGAKVYIIGHPSPNDGRKFRGTGQTPGLPDVLAFLPAKVELSRRRLLLMWEVKAKDGRMRPEQMEFRDLCLGAEVLHLTGGFDALIASLAAWGYVKVSQFPIYRQEAANGQETSN